MEQYNLSKDGNVFRGAESQMKPETRKRVEDLPNVICPSCGMLARGGLSLFGCKVVVCNCVSNDYILSIDAKGREILHPINLDKEEK